MDEVFVEPLTEAVMNDTNYSLVEILGPRRDSLYVVIPMTITYGIIFLTGLVGNISTCVVISRNKSMHTATNYYLFSLAVSDLLLLVSGLPQEMYSIWSRYPYIFGQMFCVLRGLFSETCANATVLTITAFTVERYLAICHPFLSHTMSKLSRAIKFILIIWVVAIFFAVPQALQLDVSPAVGRNPDSEMCHFTRFQIPHAFEFSTFVFFVIPMSIIMVLYALIGFRLRSSSRMKKTGDSIRSTNAVNSVANRSFRQKQHQSSRRVLKMLVAVVVAFFVCWAPFHAQRLVAIYGAPQGNEDRGKLIKLYEIVTYISGILYYVSTTINPLLYNIMSNKFRDAFKETFARCCGVACVKAQRPQCSYSILSRSLRRGPDSHTDESTGRDDPSVQTNITLTHKNSQDSMSIHSALQRTNTKGKFEVLEGKAIPIGKMSKQSKESPELTRADPVGEDFQGGTVKLWSFFVCVGRRPSQPRISRLFPCSRRETYTIELERTCKRNMSTSSCDISNSSLKDVDNAMLEDELSSYLKMVKCQQ